ncbi:MAG: hypothetical protein V8R27_05245 [Oscillospiraceae bacterium]
MDVKTVSSISATMMPGSTLRTYTHATRQMQQKAGENGQFHGADSIRPTGKQSTGKETGSSPVLLRSFPHSSLCGSWV